MQKKPNFALLDPISRELLKISEFSFFQQMRAQKIFEQFEFQVSQSKTRFLGSKKRFFFRTLPTLGPRGPAHDTFPDI